MHIQRQQEGPKQEDVSGHYYFQQSLFPLTPDNTLWEVALI